MNTAHNTVQFSGVIVTCNDAFRLRKCLESLSFCDQLVVVDLKSTDNSAAIARACGAEVYVHERVPVVEMIRESAFAYARQPWIVHIDPDEVFPISRLPEIIQELDVSDTAIVRMPWSFYFKNRRLKGTVWGGENSKPCVYHRDRIELSEKVHVSPKPLAVYREIRLIDFSKGALKHYWVDSYRQMFEKHLRYIKREGAAKYAAGNRFAWLEWAHQPLMAFRSSFITHKGWLDGVTGLLLSVFYAWYVAMSYLSLLGYQKSLAARNKINERSHSGKHHRQ